MIRERQFARASASLVEAEWFARMPPSERDGGDAANELTVN